MEELGFLLKSPLPIGVMILIGIAGALIRLSDVIKRLDRLEERFNRQLKWCLNHFVVKDD